MATTQRDAEPALDPDRIADAPAGPDLRVHCFGTLRVSYGGVTVDGFESQKVRALFAYLACHRGRPLSRDHLAAVFWPGKDDEGARRNLRQSLYNLRSLFPRGRPAILATRQTLELDPQLDAWIDVLAFEEALGHSGSRAGVQADDRLDTHRLSEAVSLYSGDFLSGFQVKDSEEFEYWLAAEQTRLREKAVGALRLLIDSYLERGEHRAGIQYAQRLVAIDALSEDAHQKLMRLYALSGRRSRALAQYEDLAKVLRRELDVDPMEETMALQQRILRQESSYPAGSGSGEEGGPVIPMAGRRSEYVQLERCMHSALAGSTLLTFVEGEPGVGKTRLIRSLLDALSSQPGTLVLKGSCLDVLPESFQPLSRALRSVLAQSPEVTDGLLRRLDAETLSALALVAPELTERAAASPAARGTSSPQKRRQRLQQAIARFLTVLCEGPDGLPCRVALLLDDLERCDPAVVELLRYLSTRLREQPLWIVGACSRDRLGADAPLRRLLEETDPAHVVSLRRLDRNSVFEIASSLVTTAQSEPLTDFIHRSSQGLPHAVAESVNLLRDRGLLRPESGRWSLQEASLGEVQLKLGDLRGLIAARVQHLPYSARRLASLAAVAGSRFEAGLVAAAAEEHPVVCDVAFDIMLQRWLIRRSPERWYHRQRPPVGAEREPVFYEFSSESIWKAIYGDIQTTRRRLMHRQIGETLEREHAGDLLSACESLAYHFRAAGLHEQAVGYLAQAAAKAERCGAAETALYYYGLAEEEIESGLRRAAAGEKVRLERERDRLQVERIKLRPVA